MTRPATAFAGGKRADGQTMGWESIFLETVPIALNTAIPGAIRTVGVVTTTFVSVVPINVTRGTVTCLRIRGNIQVWFDATELAASFDNWFVNLSLQMAPARNGAIVNTAILSANNSADQESNKIMWQRHYFPVTGGTITSPGALEMHDSTYRDIEIDVKVMRRFDRANWAMVLVMDVEAGAGALHQMAGTLRGLFKTSDGI